MKKTKQAVGFAESSDGASIAGGLKSRGHAPESHIPLRMPPLNSLRVFAIASRTLNLSVAAQDLFVSQSAVTRHISALESYLGTTLFRRERYGVSLTRAGRAYADSVRPAFEQIARATARIVAADTEPNTIRVLAYTTFSAKWLIPRLPEFLRQCSDLDVHIINSATHVDFRRDNVDLAIQFGDGTWPGAKVDLLLHDEIEPVCAPGYLARTTSRTSNVKSLLTRRLLISESRDDDWRDWLAFAGVPRIPTHGETMNFSSYLLAWQAAIDGLGIAMGYSKILAHEFRSERLVRPFARPLKRNKGYFLVRPERGREARKVRLFCEWILDSARTELGPKA